MTQYRRRGQLSCRFIHYLADQCPPDRTRSHPPDPEIAIDRQQLRNTLDSLESFSGE